MRVLRGAGGGHGISAGDRSRCDENAAVLNSCGMPHSLSAGVFHAPLTDPMHPPCLRRIAYGIAVIRKAGRRAHQLRRGLRRLLPAANPSRKPLQEDKKDKNCKK